MHRGVSRRACASVVVVVSLVALVAACSSDEDPKSCAGDPVLGTWVETEAKNASDPDDTSWTLTEYTFRTDCSVGTKEMSRAHRGDTGTFTRHSSDRITIEYPSFYKRYLTKIDDDTMKQTVAGNEWRGWTMTLTRKSASGGGGTLPGGEDGGADNCNYKNDCVRVDTRTRATGSCSEGLFEYKLRNECGAPVACTVGLFYDYKYRKISQVPLATDFAEEYAGNFSSCNQMDCGCGSPSNAKYVVKCTAADDPKECRALEPTASGQELLTCGNDTTCIHYWFATAVERDAAYNQCAGMKLRTKSHACWPGSVGNAKCNRLVNGRLQDEFYYTGTEEQRRSECNAKGGVWLGR